jgi:hypothetical protein
MTVPASATSLLFGAAVVAATSLSWVGAANANLPDDPSTSVSDIGPQVRAKLQVLEQAQAPDGPVAEPASSTTGSRWSTPALVLAGGAATASSVLVLRKRRETARVQPTIA